MSTTERLDTDIDGQLAAEFCRVLRQHVDDMKSALATWCVGRHAMKTAQGAVEPAKKLAWAAQLRDAADAEELTQRFQDARDEVDRARQTLAAAKQRLRDAVETAELDALRMRPVTLRSDAARRVERMAYVTLARARAAREEAGLGLSPEDEQVERRMNAERDAAERAARSVAAPEAGAASAPVVTRRRRRDPSEPRIVIVDREETIVGTDSMILILQAEGVSCRTQTLLAALNNKGEIEGATIFGDGKNPPWAVPRSSLVAWGRERRLPAQ